MRKVASYSFSKPVEKDSLENELATLDGVVKAWLDGAAIAENSDAVAPRQQRCNLTPSLCEGTFR